MPLTIRRMSSDEDIEKLIALGRLMHAESQFKDFPFDEVKLRHYGRHYIANPNLGVGVLVEDNNGEALAMVVGFITEMFFSTDKYAGDFAVYVRPDRRGGFAAVYAMQEFEDWAQENGARMININVHAKIDDARAMKFFTGRGYELNVPSLTKRIG